MTDQVEQKKEQPQFVTIVGKDLAMIKKHLLGQVGQKYNEFCQALSTIPGDEALRLESLDFFDRGLLRIQESIVALKSIVTQTQQVNMVSPQQTQEESGEAKEAQGAPEVNRESQAQEAQIASDAA